MEDKALPKPTDGPASHAGEHTIHKKHKKRKHGIIALTLIFIIIGIIWFFYWLLWAQFHVYTEDAYVNGNLVEVMSQVAGKVTDIYTDDTYKVEKGQLLAKLDPTDMAVALQRAEADLAEMVRRVRQMYENVNRIQATVLLRKADLIRAQLDLQRRTGLVGQRAISREELQHYQTALKTAESQYDYALHDLRFAQSAVENINLYSHPLVERAKANVKIAYLNLVRCTIVSPATGYVAKRSVQVGQSVAVNTPLLAVVPLRGVWVDANYKETELNHIRIGQPVTLSADAYPDVKYHGKIVGLNPGTGAAFSLLPPQNATGNWIKILQRLPVRVSLDSDEIEKNPLAIGLSMRVTTNVHDTSGYRLEKTPSSKLLYSTNVYANQLNDVNQIIDRILKTTSPDMVSLNLV